MPLKIVEGRNAKTKSLYIRGTYLGIPVDASCRTDRRSVARAFLKRLEGQIERGEYPPKQAAVSGEQPTFLSAAVAYMEFKPRRKRLCKYIAKLIKHFGATALTEIDQAAIDAAAVALHPNAGPGTRNACVYTPASAILHHAGVKIELRRPDGAKGRVVTDWITPNDADAIIAAADDLDAEFGVLLRFMLYTGVRLNEALRIEWDGLYFDDAGAWMRRSKGGPSGAIKLRQELCDALREHQEQATTQRVFRFHQGGHFTYWLVRAKLKALGIETPTRRPIGWKQPPNRLRFVTYHVWRHTWATWMRRYGKATVDDLVDSGNWTDARSARRYVHAAAADVWDRVEQFPALGKTRGPRAS